MTVNQSMLLKALGVGRTWPGRLAPRTPSRPVFLKKFLTSKKNCKSLRPRLACNRPILAWAGWWPNRLAPRRPLRPIFGTLQPWIFTGIQATKKPFLGFNQHQEDSSNQMMWNSIKYDLLTKALFDNLEDCLKHNWFRLILFKCIW